MDEQGCFDQGVSTRKPGLEELIVNDNGARTQGCAGWDKILETPSRHDVSFLSR
jgi:hypothetical protein